MCSPTRCCGVDTVDNFAGEQNLSRRVSRCAKEQLLVQVKQWQLWTCTGVRGGGAWRRSWRWRWGWRRGCRRWRRPSRPSCTATSSPPTSSSTPPAAPALLTWASRAASPLQGAHAPRLHYIAARIWRLFERSRPMVNEPEVQGSNHSAHGSVFFSDFWGK